MANLSISAIKHHLELDEETEDPVLFSDFPDFHDFQFSDFDPVQEWLVDPDLNPNPMPDSDLAKECEKMEKVVSLDQKMEKVVGLDQKVEEIKEEVRIEGSNEVCTVSDSIKAGDEEDESSEESEGSVESSSESEEDSSSSQGEPESDSKSETESEDSSSSDEEEEEKRGVEVEEGEINEDELDEMIAGSDGEEEVGGRGGFKSRHEIEDLPPVPPVEVSLEPHHQTLPVGFVSSIVENRVIVEGSEKHSPLNEGSILWITETRSLLGRVDEIFGPVRNPYYIIRYNSANEIPPEICVGVSISFVVEFADHILNQKELYQKGYDGEDVTDEVEFSDDEKEAEFRRSLRQKRRDSESGNQESGVGKKTTFQKQSQPPRSLPAAARPSSECSNSNSTSGASKSTPNRDMSMAPSPPVGPGFPPQPQHYNIPAPPQGFPLQPQSVGIQGGFPFPVQPMGIQGSGLPTNWIPNQHPNQVFNNFSGGLPMMMAYLLQQQQQQQFLPNFGPPNANLPWFGGPVNPSLGVGLPGFGCGNINVQGPLAPTAVGMMGFGASNVNPLGPLPPTGDGIMGFGSGNVNNPQGPLTPNSVGNACFGSGNVSPQGSLGSINAQQSDGPGPQGEPRPSPMQFNQGRPPWGRRPFQRGGRRSFGGRGGNRRNG